MIESDAARSADTTSARERELVGRIREGDREAFASLFRSLHDGLNTFATTITGSRDAACDVVQDVFISVWENRVGWRPATTVRAYFYRAVRNRAVNVVQRSRVAPMDASSRDVNPTPFDDAAYRSLVDDYHRTIALLPERRRTVYRLCKIYGLSYDEAATVLGVSVNTIRSQMSDAHAAIRRALSAYLD